MKRISVLAALVVLFGCKTTQINSKSTTLNLKNLHTEKKEVQTSVLFESKDKVISLQIAKNGQLAEHFTKIPALLVCVSGKGSFEDENGQKINLQSGDYVKIEPNVKHWVDAFEDSNFLLIK